MKKWLLPIAVVILLNLSAAFIANVAIAQITNTSIVSGELQTTNTDIVLVATDPNFTNVPVVLDKSEPGFNLSAITALLSGKFGWLSTVITYLGSIVPFTVVFGPRFKRWASDKLNEIAESSDKDDDAYLTKLFSSSWYRPLAFFSRFTPFQLPTLADLERAIKLQGEVARKAVLEDRATRVIHPHNKP